MFNFVPPGRRDSFIFIAMLEFGGGSLCALIENSGRRNPYPQRIRFQRFHLSCEQVMSDLLTQQSKSLAWGSK